MKKFFLPLVAGLFLMSCEKDSVTLTSDGQNLPVETRGQKVYVCHNTVHNAHVIYISINALPAHLNHLWGTDAVDMDGDGVFNIANECSPGVDCDDTDPQVQACCSNDGLLAVRLPDNVTIYVHPTDNSDGIEWGEYGDVPGAPNATPATALSDLDGEGNTAAIVAAFGPGTYAAKLCADLDVNGCDDWYLPSEGELYAMYVQLGSGVGGSNDMPDGIYWSSTEDEFDEYAWKVDFSTGTASNDDRIETFRCRCVRR